MLKKNLFALVLCLLFATCSLAERPNIVYILADDLGYGDISCQGQEKFTTPNIDRLASEGARLTQHYSGSTVCAPSRCVLMTGKHTGHAYIRSNSERSIGQMPLADGEVTIAEILHKAGYKTGCFGKWGLGAPKSEGCPLKQGFDRFFGFNCQRNAHNYYADYFYSQDEKFPLDGKTYMHDLVINEALKWIRENKDTSFFCYLPVAIPHAALHVPEKYVAPFRKKFPEFEKVVGKYGKGPDITNPQACFAGMITKLDEDVGRLLALLKKLNLDKKTVVIFSSDNGPHREGGHRPDLFNSSGPFRGGKLHLTEGGLRVPMLVRWPGKINPGTVSDHISAFQDFLPTACDLAGLPTPKGLDGVSFLPTLLGENDAQKQHDYLYWEFVLIGGATAVRQGKWKAMQNGLHKNPDAPVKLYNLEKDIREENDVAAENPKVVKKMLQIMRQARTPSRPFWLYETDRRKTTTGSPLQ